MANKMSEKKKSASQSGTEEVKAQANEKEATSVKAASAAKASTTRSERQSKPAARREVKSTPAASASKKSKSFRDWRVVRFVREAYHELRYKVTWPTFPEARNMTLVVIALSTVIGLILGLVDAGLFQLFKLISGK